MEENEYLSNRLEPQQKWYSDKSRSNQSWHKRLQIIQLVTAACIPLLVSYASDDNAWVRLLIGILGVAVAVITGLQAVYKFEEKWIKYRTTAESLKHEKYRFLTRTTPYDVADAFPLLVQTVEALISQENRDWSQYIAKKSEQKAG